WDRATAREVRRVDGLSGGQGGAAFSPDGRLLAFTIADGSVRVQEAATGREVVRLGDKEHRALALAFTSDGASVVTAGLDHTARTWRVATGRETGRLDFRVSPRSSADVVFLAPGGQFVAARHMQMPTSSIDLWGERLNLHRVAMGRKVRFPD